VTLGILTFFSLSRKQTDRESPEYSALYARIRMVHRPCSSFLSSSLIWVYFVSPGFVVCFVGVWIWMLLARIMAIYILAGALSYSRVVPRIFLDCPANIYKLIINLYINFFSNIVNNIDFKCFKIVFRF